MCAQNDFNLQCQRPANELTSEWVSEWACASHPSNNTCHNKLWHFLTFMPCINTILILLFIYWMRKSNQIWNEANKMKREKKKKQQQQQSTGTSFSFWTSCRLHVATYLATDHFTSRIAHICNFEIIAFGRLVHSLASISLTLTRSFARHRAELHIALHIKPTS